jgi:predicted AAA+ superfamily ATPase
LRENRALISDLQRKLKEHTEQTEMTKKKYADWNAELSRKLQDLRDQKRNWMSETAALRLAEKELRVRTFLLVVSKITYGDLHTGAIRGSGKSTGRGRTARVAVEDFYQRDGT